MAHARDDTPAAAVPRDTAPTSVADLDSDHPERPLSELRPDQGRHLVVGGEGIRIHLADGRTLIDGITRAAASATRIDMYHRFDKPDRLHVAVDTHDRDDLEATIARTSP